MSINIRAFCVASTGVICSIFIIILNTRLLCKFRKSSMRQKPEYHLFTLRFVVDITYSLTVSIYDVGLMLSYIEEFVLFEHKPLFFVTQLASNLLSTRFLLALLISTERLIAVFFPIIFHNNRRRLSIYTLVIMVIIWGSFEDVMYYNVCNISPFEKRCSILACTWNDCFISYWTGNKLLIGAFSCVSSLILFVKLMLWKRTLNLHSDAKKTNYLCIADAFLTLLFDFTPFLFTLIFKTQLLSADVYGPYNSTAKSIACLVDAILATFVLESPKQSTTFRTTTPSAIRISKTF